MEKNTLVNSNLTLIQQESIYISIQHLICKKMSEFNASKKEIKDYISSGFDINYTPNKGWSLLMMASYFNHSKLTHLLIDLDSNLEYQDKNGANCLIVSIANQSVESFMLLMDKKVSINVQDKNGVTPLLHACEIGNEKIINELVQRGADLNIKDNNGLDLLHYANKCQNKTEAIMALIEKYKLENSIEIMNEEIKPKKRFKI